jgi:hypothetical protein
MSYPGYYHNQSYRLEPLGKRKQKRFGNAFEGIISKRLLPPLLKERAPLLKSEAHKIRVTG